jgi:hypothetical protein
MTIRVVSTAGTSRGGGRATRAEVGVEVRPGLRLRPWCRLRTRLRLRYSASSGSALMPT